MTIVKIWRITHFDKLLLSGRINSTQMSSTIKRKCVIPDNGNQFVMCYVYTFALCVYFCGSRNVLLFCFVLQQIFQILSIVSIEKLQLKFYFYTAFYVPSSGSASYIFVTRFLLQSNCCTCIAAGNCIFCCTSSPSMSEDTVVR